MSKSMHVICCHASFNLLPLSVIYTQMLQKMCAMKAAATVNALASTFVLFAPSKRVCVTGRTRSRRHACWMCVQAGSSCRRYDGTIASSIVRWRVTLACRTDMMSCKHLYRGGFARVEGQLTCCALLLVRFPPLPFQCCGRETAADRSIFIPIAGNVCVPIWPGKSSK